MPRFTLPFNFTHDCKRFLAYFPKLNEGEKKKWNMQNNIALYASEGDKPLILMLTTQD